MEEKQLVEVEFNKELVEQELEIQGSMNEEFEIMNEEGVVIENAN